MHMYGILSAKSMLLTSRSHIHTSIIYIWGILLHRNLLLPKRKPPILITIFVWHSWISVMQSGLRRIHGTWSSYKKKILVRDASMQVVSLENKFYKSYHFFKKLISASHAKISFVKKRRLKHLNHASKKRRKIWCGGWSST